MIIVAIDPGKNGGIVAIDFARKVSAHKMPETEKDIFDLIGSFKADKCYIEKIHSTPIQGHVGAFTFGTGYGGLRMACLAHQLPFETVSPARWQKDMNCLTKGDKNVTKRRAQELFPHLKINHAIADALLIAEWARIMNSTKIFPSGCSASLPGPQSLEPSLEAPFELQEEVAKKTLLDL